MEAESAATPKNSPYAHDDLLTRGVIFCFIGSQLAFFLTRTHTWFYGFISSTLTISCCAVGLLGVVAGAGERSWRPTSLPLSIRIRNLALWTIPAAVVAYSPWFSLLLHAAKRDAEFSNRFNTAFICWFAYLVLGGRLFAQLIGFSWYRLKWRWYSFG